MRNNDVARHAVRRQRLEKSVGDMRTRAQDRFDHIYERGWPMRVLMEELGYELLDHVAARSVQDPDLGSGEPGWR
ncbi:hypothetical protein [Streptomyces sp. WG-D5]